jgi:hypothetical protein
LALQYCSSLSNIHGKLSSTAACTIQRAAEKKEKALPVKILWNRIAEDETLKRSIEDSMASDVAGLLGILVKDFASYGLVEDKTTSVTVSSTTSARRFRTLETGSGSKFSFTVQTTDAATTTAAASNFDALVTSGVPLNLPSTSATIAQTCTDCADSSSTSLAGSDFQVGEVVASSGRATFILFVLLAAVFAAIA